jgi:hypothetical protein
MGDCSDLEARMSVAESQLGDLRHELYGNGQPGLISDVRDYLARQKEREEQQQKQDKKTRNKLNLALGLITVVIGMLSLAPLLLGWARHMESALR